VRFSGPDCPTIDVDGSGFTAMCLVACETTLNISGGGGRGCAEEAANWQCGRQGAGRCGVYDSAAVGGGQFTAPRQDWQMDCVTVSVPQKLLMSLLTINVHGE